MRSPHRRPLFTAAILAALSLTGACDGDDPPAGATASPPPESNCAQTTAVEGLAVAVGRRANSPAPVLPEAIRGSLETVMDRKQGYTVVRVDGKPSIACAGRFVSTAVAKEARKRERRVFMASAVNETQLARARVPEADPLQALSLAASAAKPGGTVVLADSGLQTVAPLDFRKLELNEMDPAEVVGELRKMNLLPDLSRRKVHLIGIGYTAEPQAQLDDARRGKLVAIWQEIVKAGGGEPVPDQTPVTGRSAITAPSVSPVPIPPQENIQLGCNTEVVLYEDGAVGFVPNKAEFRDSATAELTLRQVADWFIKYPKARVDITGNVAHHGPDQGDAGLSRDRALRVADALARLGVGRQRITARGDGWGPYPTRTAPPDPVNDQRNRRVVLKIVC